MLRNAKGNKEEAANAYAAAVRISLVSVRCFLDPTQALAANLSASLLPCISLLLGTTAVYYAVVTVSDQ